MGGLDKSLLTFECDNCGKYYELTGEENIETAGYDFSRFCSPECEIEYSEVEELTASGEEDIEDEDTLDDETYNEDEENEDDELETESIEDEDAEPEDSEPDPDEQDYEDKLDHDAENDKDFIDGNIK